MHTPMQVKYAARVAHRRRASRESLPYLIIQKWKNMKKARFAVVLFYSICFMLLTAAATVFFGILPGYITVEWSSIIYLLRKCVEIAILTAFSVLPLLTVAAAGKGYIFPVCATLVYTFLGFILLMVNMYLHPLSSMTAIVMRDIPGVVLTQELNIPAAFLCIVIWYIGSALLAVSALGKRK